MPFEQPKFNEYAELREEPKEDDTHERWRGEIETLNELIESYERGEGFRDFQRYLRKIEDGIIIDPEEKRPLTSEEKDDYTKKAIQNHQSRIEELKVKLAEAKEMLKNLERTT